jgi:hypothetical protein
MEGNGWPVFSRNHQLVYRYGNALGFVQSLITQEILKRTIFRDLGASAVKMNLHNCCPEGDEQPEREISRLFPAAALPASGSEGIISVASADGHP